MRAGVLASAAIAGVVLAAAPAWADKLEVASDAPLWMRLGADALLWSHIGGGAIGMISGLAAVLSPKGGRLHRLFGTVFLGAMFVAYLVGGGVALFLADGQRVNFVAAVMSLYLLLSAWWTMKRADPKPGVFEFAGLALALTIIAAGLWFIQMAGQDPSGTVDNSPPQAFYLFIAAGTFAAAGELNVILRKRIIGVSRLARHLWRMNFSWFIASGSFFLGQQKVMPEWMRGSPVLTLLALMPLVVMLAYLVVVRIPRRRRKAAAVAA